MDKFYFCVDVGGTAIKAGIVDQHNNILHKAKIKTTVTNEPNYLADSIMVIIKMLEKESSLLLENSAGLAIGAPGLVDSSKGIIKFSGNLKLTNYPLKETLEKQVTVPVKVANDADIATLAELHAGAGKPYKNFIMLTLGTGIGSGIVVNGKLLSDFLPLSGEIGHIKIANTGEPCSCGDYDCFEAHASTKALVRLTANAMRENPKSKMWSECTPETANGKTIFNFLDTDATAKQVFEKFIENLGTGIVSLINIFAPEAIVIGGAISNEKDIILKPLQTYVNKRIYIGNIGIKSNIVIAEQTGNAGIIGGKFLFDGE